MLVQHRAKRSELFRDNTIKVSIYVIRHFQQLSGVSKQNKKKKKKVLLKYDFAFRIIPEKENHFFASKGISPPSWHFSLGPAAGKLSMMLGNGKAA